MNPFAGTVITLFFPLLTGSFVACNHQKKINTEPVDNASKKNTGDTLAYHYGDAALPPQYYRSYDIRVTPGQVYLAISDYNQVLSKDSMVLTNTAFESFENAINNLHMKNREGNQNNGCTGGHTESFELYPGTSKAVTGSTYFCGNQLYGNLEGDIVAAANLFRALVPDLTGKIKATMKNNESRFRFNYPPGPSCGACYPYNKKTDPGMINIIRTDSNNRDFIELVKQLDIDLANRDREDHPFYAQFNKIDKIKHAVVAYEDDFPVSCGAFKEFEPGVVEIKRMYSLPVWRGKGMASRVLSELENWAAELGHIKCILETGYKQPEAIELYKKNGYIRIPNYGQYAGIENSLCFEKELIG